MKRLLLILFFVLLFYSCKETNPEEKNKQQVISLLFEKLAKPTELVYEPNFTGKPLSKKDSMRIDSLNGVLRKKWAKRKFIVAVFPTFIPYKGGHYKYYTSKCKGYNTEMNTLLKLKDSSQVDLLNIVSKRNDSIISFRKELISYESQDFANFDMLLTFSPIAFSKDYKKAIVVVTEMRSKASGTTDMYLLEKKKGHWVINCKVNLGVY